MPSKTEHVVKCHLSKRQRFLYEDFMSRATTKDKLNEGGIHGVMNVLMQLRKVCNHPNLFEPRPIVTSFVTGSLIYEPPSLAANALVPMNLVKESRVDLVNINMHLLSFCRFSTHDVRSINQLRPSRKSIEDLSTCSGSSQSYAPVSKDLTKLLLKRLHARPRSAYDARVAEVEQKKRKLLEDVTTASAPLQTKLIGKSAEFSVHRGAVGPVNQGRTLHSTSVGGQKISKTNGQVVHIPGLIQIYTSGSNVARPSVVERSKGIQRKDSAESYTKWLTRVKQQRKEDILARTATFNESRCEMSNQCLSSNVIRLLESITVEKRKQAMSCKRSRLHKKHYVALVSVVTRLHQKLTDDRLFNKVEILVPTVEVPSIKFHTQHKLPWKEYGLEMKKDFMRNYFKEHYHQWKFNNQKLLFPETQLIEYDCGKLQILNTLLRQLHTDQHRVLIFTQMTKVLDILEVFLNYHGYRYLRLDGSTHVEERMIRMERFNNDKRIFVFILSTRSGGVGVNLTGADTVVFYDSDWNPTMDAQAQDRCHRIGQTRDVRIYRLISERTIEENILSKAMQKRALNDIAIEGGNFTTQFFTKQGLRDIFNEPSIFDQEEEKEAKKSIEEPTKNPDIEASNTTNKSAEAIGKAILQNEDMEDQDAAEMVANEHMADMEEFGEEPVEISG